MIYVATYLYHNLIMKRSIFKLLCILYLTVVIMAEPPEKKFKIEAVAKAHQIIRNSVVVPAPIVVPLITPVVVPAPPVVPTLITPVVVPAPPVVPIAAGEEYLRCWNFVEKFGNTL